MKIIEELRQLNGGTPISVWKKKPVIPLARWESMMKSNFRQALQYIPNGYTDLYEKRSIDVQVIRELNQTELQVWKEDYLAYLEHTGNPVRGRELCAECLLKPSDDPFGLQKIFANGLKSITTQRQQGSAASPEVKDGGENGGGEIGQNQTDGMDASYPCKVVNRFECPYKKGKVPYQEENLIDIGKSLHLIETALSFASELAGDDEVDVRYKVDFDRDTVISEAEFPGIGKIDDLPIAKETTVIHVEDIYNVLTKPVLLEQVLYQYFAHNAPDSNMKRVRDTLVDLVMTHKEVIKMQDLRDGRGRNLEDSEEEIRRIKQRTQYYIWPSKKCCVCSDDICQIQCSNCNLHMCKKHWREHMVQKHPATARKYPPVI